MGILLHMPGPPPKHPSQRRRRNASPGFIQLDPAGRQGDPPEWPLITSPSVQAAQLEERKWRDLWNLPQALEWERMRCYDDVALYTRAWVLASMSADDTKLLAEVRQLDAKIGVSPKAMQGLRWEIPQQLEDAQRAAPTLQAVKDRTYVPSAATG